jgi:AcrR family transcriptional regulator
VPRLVDAALQLLESEGPEGVTVRRVAAAAGVAPMGVYNYFDGKNGLIDAVFALGFEALAREQADVEGIADTGDALREGFRRYRRLALAHPRAYELMFLRSVPAYEPSEEARAVAAESFDALVRLVRRGMADGTLAEGDPATVAQLMWAAAHGAVALEIADICLVADIDDTYDDLVEALLRGFSPQARPGSAARGGRPVRAR